MLEGEHSSRSEVTSGIPWGTVFRPLLFLILINHIAKNCQFRICCNYMGSLHQIQLDQTRKIPTLCSYICEWGLLKRKQCYIYAKQTKMASTTTKKNQHTNSNDVQDSPDVITLSFVVVWIWSIIKVNQDGWTNECPKCNITSPNFR